MRRGKRVLTLCFLFVASVYVVRAVIPPPDAVENRSVWHAVPDAALLIDSSWQSQTGERVLEQTLFDAILSQINTANRLILLDMFLFNEWQGPTPENHRALTSELTHALIDAKTRHPNMPVIVITDPVNTLYGGVEPMHIQHLKAAGVHLVLTPLVELQDSNPVYSAIWRGLIRPFGNKINQPSVPAPFGNERISVRSWLALLNFKANHRKLLITLKRMQAGEGSSNTAGSVQWQGIVSSANPHDGSSAHRNVGLQVSGAVVQELLQTEVRLLAMAAKTRNETIARAAAAALKDIQAVMADDPNATIPGKRDTGDDASPGSQEPDYHDQVNTPYARVLTESAILDAVLAAVDATNTGDEVNVLMFYLSHRSIVNALINAANRGAQVRVLLDANKDAFGRSKNGVPNRPVAHELAQAGVQVRWCNTQGEQCHAKVLHTKRGALQRLLLGSGNYTRRNLDNLNLETNIDVQVNGTATPVEEFVNHFNEQWQNQAGRQYSVNYSEYADDSWFKHWQYRFFEGTGLATF